MLVCLRWIVLVFPCPFDRLHTPMMNRINQCLLACCTRLHRLPFSFCKSRKIRTAPPTLIPKHATEVLLPKHNRKNDKHKIGTFHNPLFLSSGFVFVQTASLSCKLMNNKVSSNNANVVAFVLHGTSHVSSLSRRWILTTRLNE